MCPKDYHDNDFVCGDSCIWAYDVMSVQCHKHCLCTCAPNLHCPISNLHIMCPRVATKPLCGDKWEGTLFSWLHIYYAHLISVRFEYSVCHGYHLRSFIYIYVRVCIYVIYVYLYMHICILYSLYVLYVFVLYIYIYINCMMYRD